MKAPILADLGKIGFPCGHEDDGIQLHTTEGIVGYCSCCERGFELESATSVGLDSGGPVAA